ncbi:MAG: CRTAC1 family protein [Saprospiraceae bacterium]|nr:CRTAC1 family protein [Saprospiraceae bacterium]
MTKIAFTVAFNFFFLVLLHGQLEFSESSLNKELFSGLVMSSADLNGDYQDDLLIMDQGRYVWLGTGTGKATFVWSRIPISSTVPLWSLNVADIDRNGLADIVLGGDKPNFQILYQISEGVFEAKPFDFPYFFSQAACFYDINKDGWLDFTICDDNAKVKIFENDLGLLKNNYTWLDLSMDPVSNEAGNYGCIWSDYDQDGDGDLYISKCNAHATDPRDPRRVNLFFKNDAQQFLEISDLMGIDCGDQSWVSVMADINGDGRTDLIVANHYAPSKVYVQNSFGTFSDSTLSSGLDSKLAIFQMLLRDLDNDMDLDLILAGNGTEIWLNDGLGHFELTENGLKPFSSMVVGDFNEDGFQDIYASYAYLVNNIANIPDRLWINQANQNHWIKLGLKGTTSNIHGVGALVYVWTQGKLQYTELLSGDSYGIQNSYNVHFGLKEFEKVDSIFIKWPSGLIDQYFDIASDQFYLLTEGKCLKEKVNISPAVDTVICLNEIITISAEDGIDSLIWNNGMSTDSIQVDTTGVYFYRILTSDGCYTISQSISVLQNPTESPKLSHRYQKLICDGTEIELAVPGYKNVLWEDGSRGELRDISDAGIYYASVKGLCNDWNTDSLKLSIVQTPVDAIIQSQNLPSPGVATLISDQENTEWYKDPQDSTPLFVGDTFITPTLDQTSRFYVRSFGAGEFDHFVGGQISPQYSAGAYHAAQLNPRMEFRVFQDVMLDSLSLYTDREAKRTIQLLDADWLVVQQQDVLLTPGKNRVFVGFELSGPNKTYFLTTSTDTNMLYLNTTSPRLQRSDLNVRYPIHLEDKIRIIRSQYGENYYYAFYEWAIRPKGLQCYTDWQEIIVQVGPSSIDENIKEGCRWWLVEHMVKFENCTSNKTSYRLSDLLGRVIYEFHPGKDGNNSSPVLGTGIYILSAMDVNGKMSSNKLLVH